MKALVIATAGGLLALTALPAAAQQTPARPAPTQPATAHAAAPAAAPAASNATMQHQAMATRAQPARPGHVTSPQARRAPPPAPRETGPHPYEPMPAGAHGDMTYGRWDDAWGSRPPAPPAHFTRHADWYSHVRTCQQRYKTYNPRTDMFVPRRGETARCSL